MAGQNTAGMLSIQETVPAEEAEAIRIITQSAEAKVRTAAQTAPARRDAHTKAHGCVRAEFRVLDSLPSALRAGVFASPRVYQAWIRFSNGADKPGADKSLDGRGMAIKLMGVEDSPATTQDFLMINHPAFFVRNAADYVDFQTAPAIWRFFVPGFNPFSLRLHEALVAYRIASQTVTNPLAIRYWSMTPYCFGNIACKFSARPSGPASAFVATDGPDFLHDNLARHLANLHATFDFMVQLRTKPDMQPIEDPTVTWEESDAPFIPVASITIPRQTFDSPEQRAFCENLSFTPWHNVEAHRPLGGINRVRRSVYETISRVRHDLNVAPRQEPTGFTE